MKATTAIFLGLLCVGVVYLGIAHLSAKQAQSLWPLKTEKDAQIEQAFEEFIKHYRKFYFNQEEKDLRYYIFQKNYKMIEAHNQSNKSWTLAINFFADLTKEEMQQYYGLNPVNKGVRGPTHTSEENSGEIDWQKKGMVTRVKDQAQCGSCWAFSAVGSCESLHAIKTGELIEFSEQQLVDCDSQSSGCSGGWMDYGFEYFKGAGICKEKDYPYVGYDERCKKCTPYWHITGYKDVRQNSCKSLLDALQQQPISVAVDANDWSFYSGGIIDSCGTSLDHGVLLVGAGSEGGKDYWRIKNSWTASWGEQGYVRLLRTTESGPGMCGVCEAASYPTA